ncbi:MAG: tartrate-resistant acid phosphatase type 5 family protein [Ferruginibacter sp.]
MKKIFILSLCATISLSVLAQLKTVTPGQKLIVTDKAIKFIAMGDFGRNGEESQVEVARQMGKTAKDFDVDFFVITGDNFYPSGVASTQDYSWIASFEQIYTAHSLQREWYVVLGNHDYGGNVQAEIDYTNISRRWRMPSRYYSKKVVIDNDTTQQALFVFIDTSPFISQYYDNKNHDVATQDTAAQLVWVEKILSDPSPDIKWKIVVGHHPLYTGGNRMISNDTKELNDLFKGIFEKYNVDAYICGHDHNLQYIKPAGKTHYFVTGSGSEVTPTIKHPDGGKFAAAENGFMAFSLSVDKMIVQVINKKGKILYSGSIKK